MEPTARLEARDGVATITIDNPEKRNALGPPITGRIAEIFESLQDRTDIRVVVLTGARERVFSAGADMTYFSDESSIRALRSHSNDMREAMRAYDLPIIAMINGGVYGGAVRLAAACDIRVAVDEAEFGITPAKIGRVYSGDAIYEVMKLIGPANVMELLFTGRFVSAERAHRMGLVNHVVPRTELTSTTYEIADQIADNAPQSLVGMKKIVRALLEKGRLTEAETEWVDRLRHAAEASDDHAEGLAAFFDDRDPAFDQS